MFSLSIALIFLAVGALIAAKGKDTPGKFAPYACGEDVPTERVMVDVEEFFIYAVYFMIFDILAFIIATTIARPTNIFIPILFTSTSLLSIVVLNLRRMK
ncbi:MAG: NADH-quinone oxidoreductase subunit A [Candidatus Bathyarchaeota archaeon]|nr:NADH-quinone oxidoreductase subunit A [Candidatus Bathyarchaeota archaeon]